MKKEDIFHRDPDILGGMPVFTGTRVPVNTLTVHLKHGKRLNEFLDDFPSVERRQVEAFLEKTEQTLLDDGDARAA
jgi:uncharacterized protein (DUF433 family)